MYKVSIIIPVYNVQKHIGRCLESIFAQECSNAEIECILVDDCTPDDSMTIVDRMLRNYVGMIDFEIIKHDVNKGLSASRNTGVNHAKGDYVFFLDSDDKLESGAISHLVVALNTEIAKNNDVDVVLGNSYLCKAGKPSMAFMTDEAFFIDNSEEIALRKLLNRELFHTAWNKLVKRDLFLYYVIYFENGIIDEDLLWTYLVFYHAKGVVVVPQITYIYEDNPGSIMNTTSERIAQRIYSRIVICNKLLSCPPQASLIEYFMYIFYIFTKAINLYELNNSNKSVYKYGEDLLIIRDKLLRDTLHRHLYLLYAFFLTTKKPLSILNKNRWFRRYFDKIAKCVMKISLFNRR